MTETKVNSSKTPFERPDLIQQERQDSSILDLKTAVEKGDILQALSSKECEDSERANAVKQGIILKPFYQRDYRFSLTDESSLIESILLCIPIPPIFLVSTRVNGIYAFNVVDGQHRLRAIYRFLNDDFKLKDLPILHRLNGKKFSELNIEDRETIETSTIPTYRFKRVPGIELELELFNRYNKGTKPLTPQEIRNAVYSSPYNDYVNDFVSTLNSNESNALFKAYNITKDRVLKKKVHENIMTILYILEFGVDRTFKDSTVYANKYMEMKARQYDTTNYNSDREIDLNETKARFESFNEWILKLSKLLKIENPFSKEVYGISRQQNKFQTSIAMILSGLYHSWFVSEKYDISIEDSAKIINDKLSNSFLEDPQYRASSTSSTEIDDLINDILGQIILN